MSQHLPVLSGDTVISALEQLGFYRMKGRGKGSHVVLGRANSPTQLTVPRHGTLKRGLLRALIRNAGLTVEEFNRLVR